MDKFARRVSRSDARASLVLSSAVLVEDASDCCEGGLMMAMGVVEGALPFLGAPFLLDLLEPFIV